jgi:TM2 domain-containing membrane protein YozV
VKEAFQRPRGKQPLVAVLLSAFIPGFGQFYNADRKKGFIMVAAYLLCLGLSGFLGRGYQIAVPLPIVIWSAIDADFVAGGRLRKW